MRVTLYDGVDLWRFCLVFRQMLPLIWSFGLNCTRLTRKVFYDLMIKYTDVLGRLLHCKSFSHFFSGNIGVYWILTFENFSVSFELLVPGMC